MEGERQWAYTAPAFDCSVHGAPLQARAVYCPAGWRKRRKRGRRRDESKRRREQSPAQQPGAPPVLAAAKGAVAPTTVQQPRLAAEPDNPALLAPLRCDWPHPALLDLLVQQCWPAAGSSALIQRTAVPAAPRWPACQPHWWNRMLPELSLLHQPLPPEEQQLLVSGTAGSSSMGSSNSSSSAGAAGGMDELQLPQPNILTGYEDDWLEVVPEVLPLWAATPLAPFSGPKALLHFLVCPQQQLAPAQQFIQDVGSLYETCNLGSHAPAGSSAVHTFPLLDPPPGAAMPASDGGSASWEQQPLAQRYMAGLRHACQQLQRQLLLDPPDELANAQGVSLEDGSEPCLLVYLACPLPEQADRVAALLEAATWLAPCTPLAAAAQQPAMAGTSGSSAMPQQSADVAVAGCGTQGVSLAPLEPQAADRPAGATPAADTSRAPGGSPPPGEQGEEEAQQQGQQGQQGQQQPAGERYGGAAHLAHDQLQGDFRKLPVQRVVRAEGSRPVNIVLQVLSPSALSDISGTAARCTAFALYSKARQVPLDSQHDMGAGSDEGPPAASTAHGSLPGCVPPLMVLAPEATPEVAPVPTARHDMQQPQLPPDQQQQQVGLGLESAAGSITQRSMHCFYQVPPPGTRLVPLAVTDSCGELLHAELLDPGPGAGPILGLSGAGTNGSSSSHGGTVGEVYRLVLRRCLELLAMLNAASSPPGLLRKVVIASTCMRPAEKQVWQQLVEQDVALSLELPAGADLAVVELHALPPARYAGPDPPTGCKLLVQRGAGSLGGEGSQARITWLPPADGAASLLPLEQDTVRILDLALVAHCSSNPVDPAQLCTAEDSLVGAARELHGLAWLHAAFQGACMRPVAGGTQADHVDDAHLPLHAAMAARLYSSLRFAASALS